MKLAMNYHQYLDHHLLIRNWKVFFVASFTCLSILHSSEVAGARIRVSIPVSNISSLTPSLLTTPKPHINQPEGLEEGIANPILAEILYLDGLKCFPKLLCTIYQDREITRQGFFVNATELALAYIKLIKAVHYTSPTKGRTTTEAPKRKQPVIQIFKIPLGLITASTYQGRRSPLNRHRRPQHRPHRLEADDPDYDPDDSRDYPPYHSRSPLPFDDNDDDDGNYFPSSSSYRRTISSRDRDDDEEREFLREKVRMTKLIENLKAEDNAEMEFPGSGGVATSLLSSFLPFVGSRAMKQEGRSLDFTTRNSTKLRDSLQRSGRRRSRKPQNPFWKAVTMWRKLKRRSQCNSMYKTCPMEAWEIVRMLDLVRGQSKVLAAYLKITVDKVTPKPKKQRG